MEFIVKAACISTHVLAQKFRGRSGDFSQWKFNDLNYGPVINVNEDERYRDLEILIPMDILGKGVFGCTDVASYRSI